MARSFRQGIFKPAHPEKYEGNPHNIVFRSSWERSVMRYLDSSNSVLFWSSEEVRIPYYDKGNGKSRTYFPDFIIKMKRGESIRTIMIEVKPYAQTLPPRAPKRMTKKSEMRLIEETQTYATNCSKWEAAREFCRKCGWDFMILTEVEIYGKKV